MCGGVRAVAAEKRRPPSSVRVRHRAPAVRGGPRGGGRETTATASTPGWGGRAWGGGRGGGGGGGGGRGGACVRDARRGGEAKERQRPSTDAT